MAASVLPAALSLFFLIRAGEYREIFRTNQFSSLFTESTQQRLQTGYQNDIVVGDEKFPGLEGCNFLNAVFVSRHRKMLWQRSKVISLILAVIMAAALIACVFIGDLRELLSRDSPERP